VDAGVLTHVLAELVSERVRLQLMSDQFSAAVAAAAQGEDEDEDDENEEGRRHGRHGQSAQLPAVTAVQMLQASVVSYERILKEVKTQLVAEHQARAAVTRKFKSLVLDHSLQQQQQQQQQQQNHHHHHHLPREPQRQR
jgi:hypothetical protein